MTANLTSDLSGEKRISLVSRLASSEARLPVATVMIKRQARNLSLLGKSSTSPLVRRLSRFQDGMIFWAGGIGEEMAPR